MARNARKLGSSLSTKILGTDEEHRRQKTTTLVDIARETINDTYIEDDPSVAEWFKELIPSSGDIGAYVAELFPSAQWVRRYNVHWWAGDLIAGITVGLVVVPQAMAYALLAELTPAFGLYTTFTGACVYWIFGTSKDIVIGTTAVGSLLVGTVVTKIQSEHPDVYAPEQIAHALSLLAGAILFILGILRLGWLIEFIPYTPISAFVTSASITIISTQLPTLLGISGINSREAPYKVYVNTLKGFSRARLDAAIGISCIVLLEVVKSLCAKMEMRQPAKKRVWAMLSSLRLTFAILLYTFISYLVHRTSTEETRRFRIVGHLDKGFSHAGLPPTNQKLFSLLAPTLPPILIILIVEHIAIAKSFALSSSYTISPSQEMLAQGFSNILSPFVGGYVCTGSFGASAVLSKAGVRTPLAGLFSAMVLVLALYVLTPVFWFIPNAALAGLIVHCTVGLIAKPRVVVRYWRLASFEGFIWVAGVAIAFFTDLETAIYVTVGLSFGMLLFRMARSPGRFRGAVRVRRVGREGHTANHRDDDADSVHTHFDETSSTETPQQAPPQPRTHTEAPRTVYLPYPSPASTAPLNPQVTISPPYPGIFIYRPAEPFNYLNQASHIAHITTHIKALTRRTTLDDGIRDADRLWCEAPPPKSHLTPKPSTCDASSTSTAEGDEELPLLRAVILDFSTVNVIDITTLNGLIELRAGLDRWAAPERVGWHFANVGNRWTRRALGEAGFGSPIGSDVRDWGANYIVLAGEDEQETVDGMKEGSEVGVSGKSKYMPLYGVDRPFFHVDLDDAVNAAVREARKARECSSVCETTGGIAV